jgi:transcriptional regulator with XRE-family HTH domain
MDKRKTLKDLIKEAGLTAEELGSRLGANGAQVSNWNTGKKRPRLDTAVRIARELGVSLHSLAEALGLDVTGVPMDYRDEDPWLN